jgi:putative nucleotidyltransferase with HDIG domain
MKLRFKKFINQKTTQDDFVAKNTATQKNTRTGSLFLLYLIMLFLLSFPLILSAWIPLSLEFMLHLHILSWIPVLFAGHFFSPRNAFVMSAFVITSGLLLIILSGRWTFAAISFHIISIFFMIFLVWYISKTQSVIKELWVCKRDSVEAGEIKSEYKKELTEALLKTIDAKDSYTYRHSKRVGYYAKLLAQTHALSPEEAEYIYIAGVLHDIGKIGMPESILNKHERLTEDEYIQVKDHPIIGARIAGNLSGMEPVAPIIFYHHERYDGTGYPERRSKEDIPVGSRIISIVDSFDAMTSDREYRQGMPIEKALQGLLENMGTQYDPQLCITFVDLIRNQGMVHPDVSKSR